MIFKRTEPLIVAPASTRPKAVARRAGLRFERLTLALEARHLFDGALAVAADDVLGSGATPFVERTEVVDKVVGVPPIDSAGRDAAASGRHLLVIDNRIAGWQDLLQGLSEGVDVLVIDGQTDGLSATAQRMVSGAHYDSLQILSHGGAGHLSLGSRTLDTESLGRYASELSAIGSGLSAEGDILLFGCDIASGSYGAEFLSALARATRADVSASTDLTGAARLDGDWDLEAATGVIEASTVVSTQAKESFGGLLVSAALTVVQSSESGTTPGVLSTTAPLTAETLDVAIGEVVRMRAVIAMPEDPTSLATELRVALADGLVYLNDGSTTLALVSDVGMLESSTFSGLADVADGTADGAASSFADVRTIRPTYVIPNSGGPNAIANGTTNPGGAAGALAATFASGDDLRVLLGDTDNLSADADTEWIIVEFNVAVVNQLSNQDALGGVVSATTLPVSFTLERGGPTQSISDTDTLRVREPIITGLDKHVVSVSGNTVTFEARFTNSGNAALNDVRVFDDFAGAANIGFAASGTLPGGATDSSTATALDIRIPTVAAGATVTLTYTATISDLSVPVPSRDVVVTGTSLSLSGTTLTTQDGEDGTGAPIVGVAVSSTSGERTGADGAGAETVVLNNYSARDGAGLSTLLGHLWDDTMLFNNVEDPAENDLAGVTVTLTWAGPDNVFGNGDDVVSTTTTLAVAGPTGLPGDFFFGGLASGDYRVSAPTTLTDAASGPLAISFDGGGAGPFTDGLISLTMPEGIDAVDADFGYVKLNAVPTVTVGVTLPVAGGVPTAFTGADRILIADSDLLELFNPSPLPPNFETLLSVTQGALSVNPTSGVTIAGNGTSNVTLVGLLADINTALGTLTYTSNAGYVGNDTLTVTVNDHGNVGDFDGDGVPNEVTDDNRQAIGLVDLTMLDPGTANLPPVAPSISVIIDRNATVGSPESRINGMPAPTDPDVPAQPLTITVLSVPPAGSGVIVLPDGTPVQAGQSISISNLQNLSFVPNQADPTAPGADGLIPAGALQYRVSDPLGANAQGSITIRVNTVPFVPPPPPPPGPPVVNIPPPVPPPNVIPPAAPFVPSPQSPPFSDLTNLHQDFDPFQPWTQNKSMSSMSTEQGDLATGRVAPQMVKAANLTQDEAPEPKAKPKAKLKVRPAARSDSSGAIVIERLKPFTEQVKAARVPFKRPTTVAVRPNSNPR